MSERFIACGKEVLRDGEHFADMNTPGAATVAALMFNRFITATYHDLTEDEYALVRGELRG